MRSAHPASWWRSASLPPSWLYAESSAYRRKETAVRKIFGASVASILERANIGYGTIVLICFALSCPIAAVITSRWLQNFVDRVHISPWVFALALVAVSAVTALIVTAVFYRRATANPRDGLQ